MKDLHATFPFDNSYARLPDRFFARLDPVPVAKPGLIAVNAKLAAELGLDPEALSSPDGLSQLAGNTIPDGAEPLAMAYAGHQFGGWVPQLGDGRAILLGEVIDHHGQRRDIQLKGSGRTPFSRMGDGRAWVGPVVREYLVSEAMHALGIPTTRSLAAVTTGEPVIRETDLPGAILTRVAASHIRVGTFQYFAAREDTDALSRLTQYALERHYPERLDDETPALALLDAVVSVQARLIARWMGVGFIHGVMNTDNTTISGETIDYGPCAFMDTYHPETVFSSIDQFGRYAYRNQPVVGHWNLAQLASSLLPLIDDDTDRAIARATEVIEQFPARYRSEWADVFTSKIGLPGGAEGDAEMADTLLAAMAVAQADFTLTFAALTEVAAGSAFPATLAVDVAPLDEWAQGWRATGRLERAAMHRSNPVIIPRNHLVEEAISASVNGDHSVFQRYAAAWSDPWLNAMPDARLSEPPTPAERIHQTFCGT